MSCCGGKRRSFFTMASRTLHAPRPRDAEDHEPPGGIVFEYAGVASTTVTGPVTWRRYHFGQAGSRIAVDTRDAAALDGMPLFRRVAGP